MRPHFLGAMGHLVIEGPLYFYVAAFSVELVKQFEMPSSCYRKSVYFIRSDLTICSILFAFSLN